MLDRLNETIVAISSPPGFGPLGIVRLSGGQAISIVSDMVRLATDEDGSSLPGFTRRRGEIVLDTDRRLPADFYVFRAPRSYTHQDMVEIHTIGSPAVLETVRRRAIHLGATPAQAGEFTARAFLSGAMDLASAEAVAGVIAARTDTQLRAARRMMDGSLHQQIGLIRNQLAELLALVEADIDFSEEPIEFITPASLRQRLAGVGASLKELLCGAASAERFDTLPRILLLGQPNAGKSTLMNHLAGTERAIAASVAGTTRDILSATIQLEPSEAVLLDAAGVDASDDELIAQARAMTLSQADRVDLVCLVADGLSVIGGEADRFLDHVRSLNPAEIVSVISKCDLLSSQEQRRAVTVLEQARLGPVCSVSVFTDTGVEELRKTLAAALDQRATTVVAEALLISERQGAAISLGYQAVERAASISAGATETIDCADVLAFELREALDHLGMVTGEVTTEDLLAQVFSRFCIGK